MCVFDTHAMEQLSFRFATCHIAATKLSICVFVTLAHDILMKRKREIADLCMQRFKILIIFSKKCGVGLLGLSLNFSGFGLTPQPYGAGFRSCYILYFRVIAENTRKFLPLRSLVVTCCFLNCSTHQRYYQKGLASKFCNQY